MFSQTAEYALRAMVCLAQHSGQPLTTAQIAQVTLVPPGYLSKVLQTLTRSGMIGALRGLHGGYRLARAADRITILAVINAVDPIKRIQRCPLGLREHGTALCPLHRRLDAALASIETLLGEATLDTMLAESPGQSPLCPLHDGGTGSLES